MQTPTLLPAVDLVHVDHLTHTNDRIIIVASARRGSVPCPACGQLATRVHSHYERTLADEPWHGVRVVLRLRSRRWFCEAPACSQAIFTEPLPGLAHRYARRTDSLNAVLRLLAYIAGGEAGARYAAQTGIAISPDTLLRMARVSGFQGPAPRVLGVDDWAMRRGLVYGTILVDLEAGRPLDLLPDRLAATLTHWLEEHPGAEIIARDRSSVYADAIRAAAPQAVQVADRWHLLKNLTEALVEILAGERPTLEAAAPSTAPQTDAATQREDAAPPEAPSDDLGKPPGARTPSPPASPPQGRSPAEREGQNRDRARRMARYEEVQRLRALGCSQLEIAKRMRIHRQTVKRYLTAERFPEWQARPRYTALVPYEAYLQRRWEEGCHDATQLWRELGSQGYRGSLAQVQERVAPWRRLTKEERAAQRAAGLHKLSPRTIVWWLLLPDRCNEGQAAYTARLQACSERVRTAAQLAREFFVLVRQRTADGLEDWLERAAASGVSQLKHFCKGLRADEEAVTAALKLEWSSGPTEGQINRLKLVKRQMYGRAGLDLLRGRFLPLAPAR